MLRFRKALSTAFAMFTSVFGIEEAAVYTAIVLLAEGCWQIWKPGAFLVPGAVMLWMYLPPRKAFVEKEPRVVAVRRKET